MAPALFDKYTLSVYLSIFHHLHTRWWAKGLDDNEVVPLKSKLGNHRSQQLVLPVCGSEGVSERSGEI